MRIEAALRNALRDGAVKPHFQPLVSLKTGSVIGFEALARWTLADGERVPPNVFIPLAEDLGLISELSDQLLREACREASNWPGAPILAFNLSPAQCADLSVGRRIVRIAEEEGLSPKRLEIELTETAIVLHFESAQAVLRDLRSAGVKVALDDFGTEYSSLSQLARSSFDKLKIGQSFIRQYDDEKVRSILASIVAMADALGMTTVAEGVEDAEHDRAVRALGCDIGQGWLYGRPAAAPPALDMLLQEQQRSA